MGEIVLLGLGPGDAGLLTRQAWDVLVSGREILVRTSQHPVFAGLPSSVAFTSCDDLYEQQEDFKDVYAAIVERVLSLGRRPQGIVYAVPGHPYVAEATGPEIARRARAEGLAVRLVEGLSFLEPCLAALGLDPFPQTTLVDALQVATAHHPPFSPAHPALIAQLYSRNVASEVKLTLMAVYPDDFPVKLIHAAGTPQEIVEELALWQIDRSEQIGLLTSLFLPALHPASGVEAFQEVVAHLRDPQGGCPWDLKQTHLSMRPYLLEEAYEAVAALDAQDPQALREELGDLFLLILMHSQIASENGDFNFAQVVRGIHEKIVRRHPHVFGEVEVSGVDNVLKNWDQLKAEERAANGETEKSLLDGVSIALPALLQAQEIQSRAKRVGFDWPDVSGVLDKVQEELGELAAEHEPDGQGRELGDVLFSLVNLARHYGVDAETALRETTQRFRQRFLAMERIARQRGLEMKSMELDALDTLWNEAKASLS